MGFIRLLIILLALPGTAWAHRVNVFAHVEGDTLQVEGYFQRGVPAKQSIVEVRNGATGQVYTQGKTDGEGRVALAIPPQAKADRADLDILLRAGEGHQNHWTVQGDEYLPPTPAPRPGPLPSKPVAAATTQSTTQSTNQSTTQSTNQPTTPPQALVCPPPADPTPLIEAAVERKIAPLRQMLLDSQEPGLREVVGGVGYLVGIAGLLAYARSRRVAAEQP